MGNRLYITAKKDPATKVYMVTVVDDFEGEFIEVPARAFEEALASAEKKRNNRNSGVVLLQAMRPYMHSGFVNMLCECAKAGLPVCFECGKSKATIALEDIEAEFLAPSAEEKLNANLKAVAGEINRLAGASAKAAKAAKWQVDRCPDANGHFTIRKAITGDPHGDTDSQPIATVYDAGDAKLIVDLVNRHRATVNRRRPKKKS